MKQPRGRIPRTVVAVIEPAPAAVEARQDKDRLGHGAGEMGDCGIDRDDKIEVGDQRRRILEAVQIGG